MAVGLVPAAVWAACTSTRCGRLAASTRGRSAIKGLEGIYMHQIKLLERFHTLWCQLYVRACLEPRVGLVCSRLPYSIPQRATSAPLEFLTGTI